MKEALLSTVLLPLITGVSMPEMPEGFFNLLGNITGNSKGFNKQGGS